MVSGANIRTKIKEHAKDVLKVICKMLDVDDIRIAYHPQIVSFDLLSRHYGFFGLKIIDDGKAELPELVNNGGRVHLPDRYDKMLKKSPVMLRGNYCLSLQDFARRILDVNVSRFETDVAMMLADMMKTDEGLGCECLAGGTEFISNVSYEELLIKADLECDV